MEKWLNKKNSVKWKIWLNGKNWLNRKMVKQKI